MRSVGFNPMTTPTLYVVRFESHDGFEPDGQHSVWSNLGDAEAAVGEAKAMDPEGRYFVEEITEQTGIPHHVYTGTSVPF